jgi:hypothetical protein
MRLIPATPVGTGGALQVATRRRPNLENTS